MTQHAFFPATAARVAFLDFEGTGTVSGYPDEPWQVAFVLVENGQVRLDSAFTSYLRIGDRPFSSHAPGRHAELRDTLRAAPLLRDLWPSLAHWFTHDALGAHNTATEKRYLRQSFPLVRRPLWMDTLKLARSAFPDAGSHSLTELLHTLDLYETVAEAAPGRAPHDALFDALGSAFIFTKLLTLSGWRDLTLEAMSTVKPPPRSR